MVQLLQPVQLQVVQLVQLVLFVVQRLESPLEAPAKMQLSSWQWPSQFHLMSKLQFEARHQVLWIDVNFEKLSDIQLMSSLRFHIEVNQSIKWTFPFSLHAMEKTSLEIKGKSFLHFITKLLGKQLECIRALFKLKQNTTTQQLYFKYFKLYSYAAVMLFRLNISTNSELW